MFTNRLLWLGASAGALSLRGSGCRNLALPGVYASPYSQLLPDLLFAELDAHISARRSGYVATVGWRWLHREVDIRECTFPVSELETLKAEIWAVPIQLFSTRSAVDGGEKLIRVYHGDGYINIRQETIEQPQWRQLDDSLDRILKRFWPPPANPALREEARITPLAAQETRSADRGSQ